MSPNIIHAGKMYNLKPVTNILLNDGLFVRNTMYSVCESHGNAEREYFCSRRDSPKKHKIEKITLLLLQIYLNKKCLDILPVCTQTNLTLADIQLHSFIWSSLVQIQCVVRTLRRKETNCLYFPLNH